MACLTCDHTMQSIAIGKFWCPRCGTLRVDGQDREPRIVQRAHDFSEAFELSEEAMFWMAEEDATQERARIRQANVDLRECCLLPSERS
jgi:hypothetical protein